MCLSLLLISNRLPSLSYQLFLVILDIKSTSALACLFFKKLQNKICRNKVATTTAVPLNG